MKREKPFKVLRSRFNVQRLIPLVISTEGRNLDLDQIATPAESRFAMTYKAVKSEKRKVKRTSNKI